MKQFLSNLVLQIKALVQSYPWIFVGILIGVLYCVQTSCSDAKAQREREQFQKERAEILKQIDDLKSQSTKSRNDYEFNAGKSEELTTQIQELTTHVEDAKLDYKAARDAARRSSIVSSSGNKPTPDPVDKQGDPGPASDSVFVDSEFCKRAERSGIQLCK